MKRIYLLIALVFAIGATNNAKAQNIDLELYHVVIGDTMYYNGSLQNIIRWGFINNGPTALVAATDTIILRRAYTTNGANGVRLSLPSTGLPVGDTVYFADTVGFSNAPSSNPYNWCDTAAAFRSGSAMTDTQPMNNFKCNSVTFIDQNPVSIANVVAENSMAVYPNPASNNITVSYNLSSSVTDAKLVIRNLVGQTVYQETVAENSVGTQSINVDVSSFSAGMYVAELNINGSKVVTKFSVAK